MAYDPSIFNISPYYDDFDPDNRFLRLLFKPGYAVQARELTQIQSILQDQISKIGDHLFKDGSRIVGAPITVRNANYLALNTGTGTPFSAFDSNDWDSLVGGTIYWGATASGTIAHVLPPETDDKLFVVLDYTTGYPTYIPTTGVTLGITTDSDLAYSPFVPAGATYNGMCKLVTVGDGIFYVDGSFVVNNEQSFTPYVVSNNQRILSGTIGGVTFSGLDKKVGFSISRTTVTSAQDSTLLDPSFGSPNYRAPGADRFVTDLELAQTGLDDVTDDFIEMLRFENGIVTKKTDRIVYGDISKTLSERTYDESGSYVVNPFDVNIRESATPPNENLDVVIGPGKAYVFGNEVETQYPTVLGISKGRSTESVSSIFSFNTGNILGVCLDIGTYGITAYTYFNTLNGGSAVVKFTKNTGAVIGEAKVHGLIPKNTGKTGGKFSMYLYGVCAGSVIQGASTAVVYGQIGATGYTWGVFYPSVGTTFSALGASGANDTCLVYEITPSQGIASFSNLSYYGMVSSNTTSAASNPMVVAYTNGSPTVTTYTVSQNAIDLPDGVPASYIDVAPDLSSTPTTDATVLRKYSLVNATGLALNAGNYSSGANPPTVEKSGNNLVLTLYDAPSGFTASALRMSFPYKYTPTFTSASIRTKTSTTNTITDSAYTMRSINGRIGITLPHWDVYSVSSITVNGTNKLVDFELDDGQREGFYDYSALIVKKSKEDVSPYSVGTGITLSCSYKYFAHGGTKFGPFVGTHSYSGISYDQIPLFTNPRTGKTVSLANCLDFRHSGVTLANIHSKPYGQYETSENTSVTWNNYLPRIDRLSLKLNPIDFSTKFEVDSGTPEMSPQSPPEEENSMTISTLVIPAYTHRPNDVVVNKNDIRRYTMTDIHDVEKRIDNIEVFSKLSVSEAQMEAVSVKPFVDSYIANGGSTASLGISSLSSEPVKTSIYTDDFYGHAGGDVSDADHRCSVDYDHGEMRPMFVHNFLSLGTPSLSAGLTLSTDGILSLNYTSSAYISSNLYNKSIKINPTGTVNWLGFAKLTKEYDTVFDTGVRPVVYNNNMLENDNWIGSNANNTRGFGTQWNDWEYLWTGVQIRKDAKDEIQKRLLEAPRTNSPSSIPTVNSGNEKTSVNRSSVSIDEKVGNLLTSSRLVDRIRQKTPDNRIVDRTVVPYIPTGTVGITAYGMRPLSTGLNLYVDGVLVKSGITANSNGTVGVTFAIGSEGYIAGEKSIRISDNSSTQNATQAVDAVYYCGGTIKQRFDGVYSTRNPIYRRQTVTSEGIIKDPFNREVSYDNIEDSVGNNQWIDPLCQTFFVDKKRTPEGIFVKSVTLYFDKKDSTLPVTIQLRPTISGYPSPSVSIPFTTVTLMPSQVSTGLVGTTTTPVGTTFTFSSPVYLQPGEYAIAVMTNSRNYSLRANDTGINLTNNGRSNNPLVGTLYQPQSVGAAAQNLNTDIAFGINRCEFVSGYASGTATYTGLDVTNCQVVKVSVPQIVPLNCTSAISLGGVSVLNNQNKYLTSVFTSSQSLVFTLTRPTKTYISPVLDTRLFFGVGAQMIATDASTANPTSSYVSKAITLPEDLVSGGIFASADVCCPYGSLVRAYIRWSDRGESDLFSKSWTLMPAVGGIGSPRYPFTSGSNLSKSEYDFRPTQWAWFNGSTTLRTYQIKLVFTVNTSVLSGATKTYAKLPAVKNLKMCSIRTV